MNHSTPGLPVHHQLPEFTQTHVHRVGDAIQPSHPLSSPFPPAPNPSQHQSLFQWVNSSHEVAKDWSFSFSIIPSKEHPGLISFRMDWLDFLAVQGTLKSLLQHHSSKASILRRSAFFTVQLSHPYMTTGKTICQSGRTVYGYITFPVNICKHQQQWSQFINSSGAEQLKNVSLLLGLPIINYRWNRVLLFLFSHSPCPETFYCKVSVQLTSSWR